MLFLFIVALLNKIPNRYLKIAKQARSSAKRRILSSEEKEIYYPGSYFINNFHFKLNSVVTGKGAKGLFGFAINNTEKVVAILSERKNNVNDVNTAQNTVMSIPGQKKMIQLNEKIADDGEVSIIKYKEIDPFSIFTDFHFKNIDSEYMNDVPFSKLFVPLKSYLGNDIYKQYAFSPNSTFINNCSQFSRKFYTNNWPTVTDGTDISQQRPNEIKIETRDSESARKKTIITRIGGVIGQFAGIDLNMESPESIKLTMFHGSETENEINMQLPSGDYNVENISFTSDPIEIIGFEFDLFETSYRIDVKGVSTIGVKNLTYKANKNLTFNHRGGLKASKEFCIDSFQQTDDNLFNVEYELLRSDMVPPDINFDGEKLDMDIFIYTGLEVSLKATSSKYETNFIVNCGIEYRSRIITQKNATICPCPYFLGRNTDIIYLYLETLTPYQIFDRIIIPAKMFYSGEPSWIGKQSNVWCMGGNLYSYDQNIQKGVKNSAALFIKSVKFGTEFDGKILADFQIKINIYPKNKMEKPIEISIAPFKFPDIPEKRLNYFVFIKNYTETAIANFECIDQRNNYFYNNDENIKISDGFYKSLEMSNQKGNKIIADILMGPCVNCEFDNEIYINCSINFASVQPNVGYENFIGLIYHKFGSSYECLETSISDEYSNENIVDCIYEIKNVWFAEITSLNIPFDFQKVFLKFERDDELGTKTILTKEINYNEIGSINMINFTFDIPKNDANINLDIEIIVQNKIIRENNILIEHKFVTFTENEVCINSKQGNGWECKLKFRPYNYPVIFNTESIDKDTSIIFAPAYKLIAPFSQEICQGSPSTISIECPPTQTFTKYGIFKLEFEFDQSCYEATDTFHINALLIMKWMKPLCNFKRIGEDSYIFKITNDQIKTYSSNGKTIAYFPIPFRRQFDHSYESTIYPKIIVVDVFLTPSINEEICNPKSQKFNKAYPFIHSACVALLTEDDIYDSYEALCTDCGIEVISYSYPPNINIDIKWKLFGFLLNSTDHVPSHEVLLKPKQVQFDINQCQESLKSEDTQFYVEPYNNYTFLCERCSAIRYTEINDISSTDTVYPVDSKFVFQIKQSAIYLFTAICNLNEDKNCEASIYGLNKSLLTLLAVPSLARIRDERDYNPVPITDPKIIKNIDLQFTYDREKIKYTIDTRSKIQIYHTFSSKLRIKIYGNNVGNYIRISAEADSTRIPFLKHSQNADIIRYLSIIKGNNEEPRFYKFGGSLFLYDDTTVNNISSIDIESSPKLFGINSQFIQSIMVDYSSILIKDKTKINSFCFVQSNENKCSKNDSMLLRYPEFNNFIGFINESNQEETIVWINENLKNFYPIINSKSRIVFKCTSSTVVEGEFSIPSGASLKFNGPFDLSKLYITTNVDWVNEKVGYLMFEGTFKYPQIDVVIEKHPSKYDKTYDKTLYLVNATNSNTKTIKLNLLTKYRFIKISEKFEYKIIDNNAINCVFHSTAINLNNEFCIYKSDSSLCSPFETFDSVHVDNLINFQNHFFGPDGVPIKFLLVENITFTNETLQNFFENHPYVSLEITSNDNVNLDGILKLPKDVSFSFGDNDYLGTKQLTIEKNISILDIYNKEKNYGILDLKKKEIKQISINAKDLPHTNIMDIDDDYILIYNCRPDITFFIEPKTSTTKYLIFKIDLVNKKSNVYVNISTTIIYADKNKFCIYENDICGIELGRPIKSNDIQSIYHFIEADCIDDLTLYISQDVNIQLTLSDIQKEGINYMNITGIDSDIQLMGKITIPEMFNITLENLKISNLTIDMRVNISGGISPYIDISKSNGSPTVKIMPHVLPSNKQIWDDREGVSMYLIHTSEEFIYNKKILQFPMYGGFIVQEINLSNSYLVVQYSYQEVNVEQNAPNNYCLYHEDDSKCIENVTKLKFSEMCSSSFMNNLIYKESVFHVADDLGSHTPCILDFYQSKIDNPKWIMYGDQEIYATMIVSGNADIVFLNSNLTNELNITLYMAIDNNEIITPSIIAYEGSKFKTITVNFTKYSDEMENKNIKSRKFLQGINSVIVNNFPIPKSRDFRIKIIQSTNDGIIGLVIKCMIQDYTPNCFCFYESDITKCTYNLSLEKCLPIKYSDINPSFVSNQDEPIIYLFEKPKTPLQLSFHSVYLLGYKKATVYNYDGAQTIIFKPYNLILIAVGNFSSSKFYLQFDIDSNVIDYGTFHCSSNDISIIPVPSNHGSFIHSNNIMLSEKLEDFASILGQESIENFQIVKEENEILINKLNQNYIFHIDGGIDQYSMESYDDLYDYFEKSTGTALVSISDVLNPYNLFLNRLAIRSTKDYILTFDLNENKLKLTPNEKHLYIENVKIQFVQEGEIDFKDIHVVFNNCELHQNWTNKVKGKYLFFDSSSYYSFYNEAQIIYAFEGDNIESKQSCIYIQKDKFKDTNNQLIQLNTFNSFSDKFGKKVQFIGSESTLSIGSVKDETYLLFYNFSYLTLIVEKINCPISLINIHKCKVKVGSEINEIKYAEVGPDYSLELSSNEKIIINKLKLLSDFDGKTIHHINEIEVSSENNVTINNTVIDHSITLKTDSILNLESSRSDNPIEINIESNYFEYPQLILGSNNSIKFNKVTVKFNISSITSKGYLIKGIPKSICDELKSNTFIYNENETEIVGKYSLNCKNDQMIFQQKKKSPKLSKGAIVGIAIGCTVAVVVIAIIIWIIHKKNNSENRTSQTILYNKY